MWNPNQDTYTMTTQTASTERTATSDFLGRTVLGYWRCNLHHFPRD
uniref:Uncharacterized protein n=1 Tax=Anguilla anguilla TaxID=7936 RepID=A0A0E9PLW7_ANGAN